MLDCLADSKYEHYSHFTLDDALALVDVSQPGREGVPMREGGREPDDTAPCLCCLQELRPCRCLLVGMCCSVSPHEDVNARLEARGYGHVQLAYDGMALRGLQLR